MARKQTNDPLSVVTPSVRQQFDKAFGGTLKVRATNYQDPAITNVRTCAVQTGDLSNTVIPVTVVTLAFGFAISRDLFHNNLMEYQEAFNSMLRAREIKSLKILDTAVRNYIETNRNTYAGDLASYYPFTGSALRVPYDERIGMFNSLTAIMQTMDFGDQNPDILTNPMGGAQLNPLIANGPQNANNTAYQFAGYDAPYVSNRVTNGAGVLATYYAVNPGTLGFLTRIDPTCKRGADHGNKKWTTYQSNILGETMGLFWRADCADLTEETWATVGNDGLTRAEMESFEWSMDYAIFGAWNPRPLADYSPIQKIELLASV
ncbi:hypothetical protein ACFFGQ_09810 [Rufibacter quisquiliarum]|uniref:Uncharacterized protein n=1 Tax=Rufibacter quisquiliarum TaxID=1549639 RepID=A0A839GTX1_9BACT|nr:hypothetical protein [Rufibacter quisquiliarum]